MKRRRFRLWIIVFALFSLPYFLVAFALVFERVRGHRAISAYKKQLLLRGESLDIAAHRGPRVPDADDGLPEVLRLFSSFPKVVRSETPIPQKWK